jgi:hypothetical protein|tara:strand:+ start:693 stop:926 length:234 start_codon:yes stop_codon:yes gene_type:complete
MKKEIKHVASKLKKASKAHAKQSEILSNIVKRKNMAQGGVTEPYVGSYVHGSLGGVNVGNKSYQKYYSNPGFKMPKI